MPQKYYKGLSEKEKEKKKKNIKQTKKLLDEGKKKEAYKLASKRPSVKQTKKSSYTTRFKNKFGDNIKVPSQEFSSKTGIPLSVQKEVIKRGKGAFASASSRSSVVSPTQWGIARLYAFYFKSISGKLDFDKDLAKNINFKK